MESKAEYNKQYYQDNKEASAKRHKQYQQDNKEACAKYKNQYYQDNKETLAEYNKQYCQGNKETLAEYKQQYHQGNKETIAKQKKQYRQEHKEESRVCCQTRRARKRLLPSTLTIQQWENIKEHFNNACAYCGKELPLTQEHLIPVTKGGEYTHNNITCACQSCNSSKRNKDFFVWYPIQPYYSKKREQKILKYLSYENKIQQLALV